MLTPLLSAKRLIFIIIAWGVKVPITATPSAFKEHHSHVPVPSQICRAKIQNQLLWLQTSHQSSSEVDPKPLARGDTNLIEGRRSDTFIFFLKTSPNYRKSSTLVVERLGCPLGLPLELLHRCWSRSVIPQFQPLRAQFHGNFAEIDKHICCATETGGTPPATWANN